MVGPEATDERAEEGGGEGRSWLLIKHRDEWAGPVDIAEFAPLSVKSRSTPCARSASATWSFMVFIQRTARSSCIEPARPFL